MSSGVAELLLCCCSAADAAADAYEGDVRLQIVEALEDLIEVGLDELEVGRRGGRGGIGRPGSLLDGHGRRQRA